MPSRLRKSSPGLASWILLASLVVFLLPGCGGGGSRTARPLVYEPNYIDSLDHLLHWQTLPVRVYFDVPGNWTTYYQASLPATGAESWNQPGWQAFFAVAGSAGQADVICSFVDTPPMDWSTGQVGLTEYSYNPRNNVIAPGTVEVTITVHGRDYQPLRVSEMKGVIAHELGHVLGVSGHSPNLGDLLYQQLQPSIYTPQARDLNTVRTAYQAYFGSRSIDQEPEPMDPSELVHRRIE